MRISYLYGMLLLLCANIFPQFLVSASIFDLSLPHLCAVDLVDGADEACNSFVDCVVSLGETQTCTRNIFRDMSAWCANLNCEQDALLTVATILAATDYCIERGDVTEIDAQLAQGLEFYKSGDFESAVEPFQLMFGQYGHRLLPYSVALINERAGETDATLENYTVATNIQFYTPLVYYSRGQFYLSQGDEDRASRDFLTFEDMQTAEFDLSQFLLMPEDLPRFALTEGETWTVYRLLNYGINPGGTIYQDLYRTSGRDIQLQWLDNGETLAIDSLITNADYPSILFFDCDDIQCDLSLSLQQTFSGLSAGGNSIELFINNEFIGYVSNGYGDESFGRTYAIIVPASVGDPRPPIPCEQGVHPRLSIGATVFPLPMWSSTIPLYAYPDSTSEIIAEVTQPTIIGALECTEEGNWWLAEGILNDQRVEGWVLEANPLTYLALPEYMTIPNALTFDQVLDFD